MGHSCNKLAVLAAVSLASPLSAWAESSLPKFDPKDMVPLVHGPNWVDLDGDGHKDLVMKSRVTANGPHSFSIYTFHVFAKARPFKPGEDKVELLEPQILWYTVLFPDLSPPWGNDSVRIHQGADCILRDYRLLVSRTKGTFLIEARRSVGESYSDPADVTFSTYQLEKGGAKALNEFAFIKTTESKASKSYCSVVNAFKAELGLPGGDPALDDYDYEPTNR